MSENETGSEAPSDVLAATIDENVTVRLKSGQIFRGTLQGFDQHLNIVLSGEEDAATETSANERAPDAVEGTLVVRGDAVETVAISD